jgi:DNA-binding GntR family transcriptional regulator
VRNIEYTPSVRREIHAAHENIVAAIVAGDDGLAAQLMHEHMTGYLERSVLANIPGLLDEVIDWR